MGSLETESRQGPAVDLPIINISDPSLSTAKELVSAAERYGFLYIDTRDTQLTPKLVSRQFQLARIFFSRPEAEKREVLITADSANQGWTGMGGEILDPKHQRRGDFKEALNMADFVDGHSQRPLPRSLQGHLAELAEFNTACKRLMNRILNLFALGLEVDEPKFFSDRHTEPSCTVRLLHYPPIPPEANYDPQVDIRAGAHSDYGSITLLFQRPGQPGLEIRTPDDDTWAPVPVVPEGYQPEIEDDDGDDTPLPPILVNIGDLLSYWTNGLLKSTVHRVVFPSQKAQHGGEHRYSIAYFGHPNDHTELVAVPSPMVRARARARAREEEENGEELVGYGGGATGKRAMTAKEHLLNRLNATYGYAGVKGEAEVQNVGA